VGHVGLIVAIEPVLWVSLFTSDPGVAAAAYSYFALAGPAFGFFGLGACLYFSSQGAAKVGGPVLAGAARLLLVGIGGWWLASSGAPAWTLFALVSAAMVAYGLGTALSVCLTRWGK
jgi:Na+-driven multidrug efflux pump